MPDPTTSPPTPTSEIQDTQAPINPTSDNHDPLGEVVTSGTSASTTEGPATIGATTTASNQDETAVPNKTSAKPGVDGVSTRTKNCAKRMSPSKAKTARYASHAVPFPSLC